MLRKEKSNGGYDYFARKKLLWDGENMKITNIDAANQYVTRNYQAGKFNLEPKQLIFLHYFLRL